MISQKMPKARRLIIPADKLLPLIKAGKGIEYIAAVFGCTEQNVRESYNRAVHPTNQRKL